MHYIVDTYLAACSGGNSSVMYLQENMDKITLQITSQMQYILTFIQ